MAEAYKQMISTFIRRTKPVSLRTGESHQCLKRTLAGVASPENTKDDVKSIHWQEHRITHPVTTGESQRSRLQALKDKSDARPFSSFLTDNYSRQHNYLRISVTERCNLRCLYCMPEEGIQLSPPEHNLTTPEIVYLSELFVKQGVDKIRLTGGEPTVRKDIVSLVDQIGQLRRFGLKELCITTNGISLHRKLDSMVESGLTAVNLSLDTLDPFQFTLMTRRNGHEAVMKSINRILEMNKLGAGIKLKINCVVMRGMNDREIIPFVELGRDKDLEVRFIEYMPFDGNKWSENKMLSFKEMLALIRTKFPDVQRVQDHANDTSKTYKVPGFIGRIGFITSMTHNFCGTCNRLRITSDGNLKVCLFGNSEVSLRDVLRESNEGKPFDPDTMAALRQLESDVLESASRRDGAFNISTKQTALLNVIGMAVKRKKEKHAGIGELENMKNRPMILIDTSSTSQEPSTHSPWRSSLPSRSLYSQTTHLDGSLRNTIPLHLLPHPRSSLSTLPLRHLSTVLSRRTYLADRKIRYYIAPVRVRETADYQRGIPRQVRSHRMRRLVDYIQTRVTYSRRALGFLQTPRSERSPTAAPSVETPTISFVKPANSLRLTHLDRAGAAHMVNISDKAETTRSATAVATLLFSNDKTYDALSSYQVIKGDAIAVARVAAFQAAKRTADLIPLAHPSLHITGMSVDIDAFSGAQKSIKYTTTQTDDESTVLRANKGGVTVKARVECQGKTGVEMEAITAASIGAITMFDMLKAIDKGLVIMGARVVEKKGGKSGDWIWDEGTNSLVRPHDNNSPSDTMHETSTPSKDSSDIDEWNRGLAAEFSTPEEVATEPDTPKSSERSDMDDQPSPQPLMPNASRVYRRPLWNHPRVHAVAPAKDPETETSDAQAIRPNDEFAIIQQHRAPEENETSERRGLALSSSKPVQDVSASWTANGSNLETPARELSYVTRFSKVDHAQHEHAAQSIQDRLRRSISSTKRFVDAVGRNFEATVTEEARIQQAAKDLEQGRKEKVNKEWYVETMSTINSELWPGHSNHNIRKVDSRAFQKKRFQREWEDSIYGKGSQVR